MDTPHPEAFHMKLLVKYFVEGELHIEAHTAHSFRIEKLGHRSIRVFVELTPCRGLKNIYRVKDFHEWAQWDLTPVPGKSWADAGPRYDDAKKEEKNGG